MEDTVIKVEGVYKDFMLPHERRTTLKSHFVTVLKGKKWGIETQHALKDISFAVKKGEFFGIVGRNGSGKSTLLKMLAGIYQPTKGEINVHGKLVPFIELGVGFNPELTGRENVYLNGALLGFSEKEVDKFYDEVVEFAELNHFMDQKLKNYSSGMQVRLAFSMAIRAQADILIIDEVLAVGDADFQRKCYEYFNYLKKTATTVVFVSHDMEAIRQYCEKAILINDSEIVKIGKAEDVCQAYLKQFNNTNVSGNNGRQSESQRWGDETIKTESIKISTDDKEVTIKQVVVAREDSEGFIPGIRIRNTAGHFVTGTNSKLEHIKVGKVAKGDKISLSWSMPNIFSDGNYILDPAIIDQNEITVHDWWNEALTFTIVKSRKIPYVVDPGFNLRVEKL